MIPPQRRPSPQRRKLWSIYLHFQTFHPPFSLPLVSHHSPPAGPSPTEGVEFRILFYQKFLKLDFLNHYCFLAAKKPSKYDHDQMITDHIHSDMFWKLYCGQFFELHEWCDYRWDIIYANVVFLTDIHHILKFIINDWTIQDSIENCTQKKVFNHNFQCKSSLGEEGESFI